MTGADSARLAEQCVGSTRPKRAAHLPSERLVQCTAGSGGLPLSGPPDTAPSRVADQMAAHGCHDRTPGGGSAGLTRPIILTMTISSELTSERTLRQPPR